MALSIPKDNLSPLPTRLEYHATVHDLPTEERPRERLRNYGPQALSNAELLAIILRTGTTRDNVLELAGKILAKYGGLSGVMCYPSASQPRQYALAGRENLPI